MEAELANYSRNLKENKQPNKAWRVACGFLKVDIKRTWFFSLTNLMRGETLTFCSRRKLEALSSVNFIRWIRGWH